MSVIVTGSSGFIGKRLCNFLDQKNRKIIKITRTNLGDSSSDLICDLEFENLKQGAMLGNETIFHLAGLAHDVSNSKKNIEKYIKLNFEATVNLALQASEEGVNNFIFISTVKAGSLDYSLNSLNLKSKNIYAETKRKAEIELLKLSKKTDMKICIVRPSLVYGPKLKGNLLTMRKAIDKGWFPPLPNIQNARSMVHVDDLVEACFLVENKGVDGEIYNVTDGFDYSTTEIYETLSEIAHKKPPLLRIPLVVLKTLKKISLGNLKITLNKLLEDEQYNNSKIEELGFRAKLRFENLNETLF